MRIDSTTIAQMLPHRDPILLVESVQIERAGEAGSAAVRLPGATEIMAGRRGSELLQELSLEAAAQALGVVLGSEVGTNTLEGKDQRHLLLGFTDAVFGAELPNYADLLQVDVSKEEGHGPTYVARFTVRQQTTCIATGSVMVMKG